MITLLIYVVILCLVVWVLRLILPLTGLPNNAIIAICAIIALIFLVWLLDQVGASHISLPH